VLAMYERLVATGFAWGFWGGLLANFVRLLYVCSLDKSERDALLSNFYYWLQFVGLPIVGGVLSHLYTADAKCALPEILQFHVGISAPALMKLLMGSHRNPIDAAD